MSVETKKNAQNVKEYYKQIIVKSDEVKKSIPDKQLGEKIKRVQETANDVVKYLEERK